MDSRKRGKRPLFITREPSLHKEFALMTTESNSVLISLLTTKFSKAAISRFIQGKRLLILSLALPELQKYSKHIFFVPFKIMFYSEQRETMAFWWAITCSQYNLHLKSSLKH